MSHPWYVTDNIPYFIGIPTHVIVLSLIEWIWCGKWAFRGDVVSKMIEEMGSRGSLGGFNQNKIRVILQGCPYEM